MAFFCLKATENKAAVNIWVNGISCILDKYPTTDLLSHRVDGCLIL